jgi:3-oxoacyl-[acyl-carrier protein] reductase
VELAEKNALVTGAGSGIGETIARRLAREGASVVVADIDSRAASRVASELASVGARASFVRADVTKDKDVEAMVEHAREEFGALDILVNNAGGYDDPVFPNAPIDHWTRTLNLNLRAVLLAMHHAIGLMKRSQGGAIVNIASSAGLGFTPHPGPEYAAAKAAVIRLTACLAPLQEEGVRVNCVAPYTVATAAVRRAAEDLATRGAELPPELQAPLLELEAVSDAVMSLLGDDSAAGQVLALAGGRPPQLLTTLPGDLA